MVNAIATLAYIGAPQSFVALKGFLLTRFSGIVDDTTFQALNAVPVVMGTIPDTPDLGVAQFLRDGTNPARWETLPWKDRIYTHHQLALDLSGGCISGLACVPTPETAEFLEKLFIRPYANSQLSTIHEAIAVNREIRERGLAAYLHSLQQKLSRAPRKGTK